ncbi:MAG: MFS transporter [Acidimicrobiales bacterium]
MATTVEVGATRRPERGWTGGLVAASLFAFVVLGVPDGMLGVAWPAVRHGFGLPLAALGELLVALLIGYLCITSITGRCLRRFGTGTVLLASAVAGTAGAGLFASSPSWAGVVGAAWLLGVAGGGVDAGLNTVVALDGDSRLMNLLHGCYGIGAACGPLVVTVALVATSTWRPAYLALMMLEAVLAVTWVALRNRFPRLPPASDDRSSESSLPAESENDPVSPGSSARRGILVLSFGVFFFAAALESTTASWAASYLRGPVGLSAVWAGLAVFVFEAGLTVGRMTAALISPRWIPERIARLGIVGSVMGSAALWADPGAAATVVALGLLGFTLGPVFPALMLLTPVRLGQQTAVHAVGWQLAAAATGGVGVAAVVGVVLQEVGLGGFGPVLVVLALLLGSLVLASERKAVPALRDDQGLGVGLASGVTATG